jgi:hypothetical protein
MSHRKSGCVVLCALIATASALQPARAEPTSLADYAAAERRLAEVYSLNRVAKDRIDVRWEDLQGMASPLSYRVPIQASHHPEVVFVQPDLSISLGREPDALGIGFAAGTPAQLPDMWKVTRKLHDSYLPIVESQWSVGTIEIVQTALAILPRNADVVTGKETQYIVVRMTVMNRGASLREVPLYVLVGKMGGSQNVMYSPFLAPVSRWQTPPLGIALQGTALTIRDRTLLNFRCNAPNLATFHATLENVRKRSGIPDRITNCLQFEMQLKPGEKRAVDLVVAGTSALYPQSERAAMGQIEFDSALQRATADWRRRLVPAMEYTTPEPRLNRIYKQLVLSCLQNTRQIPDRPWHQPDQTPNLAGVWPWEFAHMAVGMMEVGYAHELRPSLHYFTEHQNGIGRFGANQTAESDVKSIKGSFSGTVVPWMADTAGGLWALAAEYRYSRDVDWLKTNRSSILAAWEWIQTARAQTRIAGADGKRVPFYGLLPAGRADDDELGKCYRFTFTDSFTWYAMSEMAIAFRQAGLPEADRLALDSDDYRQCILHAMHQEQYLDPETKLMVIPNRVGQNRATQVDRAWLGNGPIHLFDTGLLKPTDEHFEPMVEYSRRKFGIVMGLMTHYRGGNEWYSNQTEKSYYKCYLGRGEIEKSLLVFYSNFVYSASSDTNQTSERFHTDEPNFSAFQPNMSGNGRMLDMMRRMLIDEQDATEGRLWLLRGCPRRWFAQGESIVLRKAVTLFGEMAILMRSEGNTITVDVDSPAWESPKEIRLVLRHPDRKPMAKATVNGKGASVDGETIVLSRPTGRLHVVCKYE